MAAHRIHHPYPVELGATVQILGEEAHHAIRVKRVEINDPIELLDGQGHIAQTHVVRTLKLPKSQAEGPWALEVVVDQVRTIEPFRPRIEVFVGAPKGDRLEQMIDQLSQVGAAAWIPLDSARTVADPKQSKLDRLQRVAFEAMKQCGRAWTLEIRPPATFASALAPAPGTCIILGDGTGPSLDGASIGGASCVRLLIGPEGGFSPTELEQAKAKGATIARLGVHTMRMETAGAVAAALIAHANSTAGS